MARSFGLFRAPAAKAVNMILSDLGLDPESRARLQSLVKDMRQPQGDLRISQQNTNQYGVGGKEHGAAYVELS